MYAMMLVRVESLSKIPKMAFETTSGVKFKVWIIVDNVAGTELGRDGGRPAIQFRRREPTIPTVPSSAPINLALEPTKNFYETTIIVHSHSKEVLKLMMAAIVDCWEKRTMEPVWILLEMNLVAGSLELWTLSGVILMG
ncbi:lipase class 3-like protein [Corchorus olitorius]|uniref:Lipase class 3-like protein n=1 Tax=Corchorus olitorius TaxID=93759 RepID=A0A1R3KK43_9ROSI|nr:lipase class 3-like protein [Corchorus olitorius]